MMELRRAGETWVALGKAFGVSLGRARQIVERVEEQDARARELEEADRRPQQPNPLHLPPRLRAMLAKECGKPDFTPEDILALDHTPATFGSIPYFGSADWKELVRWMARAGKSPVRPRKKTIADWLKSEGDAAESGIQPAQRPAQPG